MVPKHDPKAMMEAVAKQPVAIAIKADSPSMFFYKGGIITDTSCSAAVNHAVVIVGYGTDAATGKDYWLIKNTWGAGWGEKGFFKILRTTQKGPGICGILSEHSTYPILA